MTSQSPPPAPGSPASSSGADLAAAIAGIAPEKETVATVAPAAHAPAVHAPSVRASPVQTTPHPEPLARASVKTPPARDQASIATSSGGGHGAAPAPQASTGKPAPGKSSPSEAVAPRGAKAQAAARANPARLWVQLAVGGNAAGLKGDWRRMQQKHAAALKGQVAWQTVSAGRFRLLVGPMKSAADARTVLNALAKSGLRATQFSSEAGEAVTQIGAR